MPYRRIEGFTRALNRLIPLNVKEVLAGILNSILNV